MLFFFGFELKSCVKNWPATTSDGWACQNTWSVGRNWRGKKSIQAILSTKKASSHVAYGWSKHLNKVTHKVMHAYHVRWFFVEGLPEWMFLPLQFITQDRHMPFFGQLHWLKRWQANFWHTILVQGLKSRRKKKEKEKKKHF